MIIFYFYSYFFLPLNTHFVKIYFDTLKLQKSVKIRKSRNLIVKMKKGFGTTPKVEQDDQVLKIPVLPTHC